MAITKVKPERVQRILAKTDSLFLSGSTLNFFFLRSLYKILKKTQDSFRETEAQISII